MKEQSWNILYDSPRSVLFRNSGFVEKFLFLGILLLRYTSGRLVSPRSLPFSLSLFLSTYLKFWSLAVVVGTRHSGLREDNSQIKASFNYFLSHAPTVV